MTDRRLFLQTTSLATLALSAGRLPGAEDIASKSNAPVPVRKLTKGPGFHWFGYYDKMNFNASNTHVLCNKVGFEGRTPKADDQIEVGMIALTDGDKWTTLGTSKAWGWQQGCMLQWRPGSDTEVLWNDMKDGGYVCHIHDIKTGKTRTLPRAIYTVSPDAKRFIFLHRWRQPGNDGLPDMSKEFTTRMFTVNADGSDLFVLDPSGNTSHFIWRDSGSVTAWTKPGGKESGFYHLTDKTGATEVVGKKEMTVNGHNTYLPARRRRPADVSAGCFRDS